MKLTIATCQFPVDADIRRNRAYISRQLRTAKARGAQVAHFPEGALSGYAGVDMPSFNGFDWDQLQEATREIRTMAGQLRLWVILGSAHRLTGAHKPHNCLYLINERGELIDRYDKMFCAGDRTGKTGDLARYTPGNHFCVFDLHGVRCGALICHDYRYPELYREYKRRGVQLMFHSYHAAHVQPGRFNRLRANVGLDLQALNPGGTIPGITMPATMQSNAANNYMWISCPNSSARESCWAGFFVRPDGVMTGQLRRNVAGILISTVDTNHHWYDSTVAWRERAMRGIYHSGTVVRDRRSDERTRS